MFSLRRLIAPVRRLHSSSNSFCKSSKGTPGSPDSSTSESGEIAQRESSLKPVNRPTSNSILSVDHFIENVATSPDRGWSVEKFDKAGIFDYGVYISTYTTVGFRLNQGFVVLGPVAVFPRSIISWNVSNVDDINEDSLCLFHLVQPKLETLLISVGDVAVPKETVRCILDLTRKHNINVQILSTEQACNTFNFLNQQGKMVAAAMIPPRAIYFSDDDVVATQARDREFGTFDSMHLLTSHKKKK